MSRIINTENASVKRELVSPTTIIDWDPGSNTGTITYQVKELLFVNDEFIKDVPFGNFTVSLEKMIEKVYKVEVEPGVVVDVPGGLMMLAFKKAFEEALVEANAGYNVPTPIEEHVTEEVPEEVIPDTPTP